jgi:hypothetical protein
MKRPCSGRFIAKEKEEPLMFEFRSFDKTDLFAMSMMMCANRGSSPGAVGV